MFEPQPTAATTAPLTWGLCVATLNRIDILENCVACALGQSRPPSEIVIVDASDAWEAHRARIARLTDASSVRLTYLPAERKSSAAQRNQGITAASADILFLIDDDSLMYPDFAERILEAYSADHASRIAAVGGLNRPQPPQNMRGEITDDQRTSRPASQGWISRIRSAPGTRRLAERALIMLGERAWVSYTDGYDRVVDDPTVPAHLIRRDVIPGYRLTARRSVAANALFDPNLLAYSPHEDCDATFRFRRWGLLVDQPTAYLHHFDAAAGRLKRRKVSELQVTNAAFLIRKHSIAPWMDFPRYGFRMLRRCIGSVVKDVLSRDLSFSRTRGVTAGMFKAVLILTHDRETLGPWYESLQRRILQ